MTMQLSQSQVTDEVKKRIPAHVLQLMVAFAIASEPPLWSMKQGKDFVHRFVLALLYKDCYVVGYHCLYECIKKWIKCSSRTLQLPCSAPLSQEVGEKQVNLGSCRSWHALAANLDLKGAVKWGCLWIDSFDLHQEGVCKGHKKDPSWSYKLNSPGQWYMALSDAKGKFWALWGGYSPKVYDGDFLKLQNVTGWRPTSQEPSFLQTTILSGGKTGLNSVKFVTTVKHKNYSRTTGASLSTLSKEVKKYNCELAAAHSCMENGFGQVVGVFDALQKLWGEDDEQQNACVWIAVGVVNARFT